MSSPGSQARPPAGDGERSQGFSAADNDDGAGQNRRRAGGRTPGAHRARKGDGLLPGFGRSRGKPDRGAGSDAASRPDAGAAPGPAAAPGPGAAAGAAAWTDARTHGGAWSQARNY